MAAIKDRKPQSVGLSRAGIIRLGAKVPVIDKRTGKQKTWRNGKPATRPVDLDYFRLDDAPTVAAAYLPDGEQYAGYRIEKDAYGAGPTELLIYLPFGDPDRNFDASYEWWQAGGCYCRGDGEYIQKAFDGAGLDLLIRDGEVIQDYHDNEWSLQKGRRVPCSGSGETRYWDRCAQCRLSAVMRVLVRDPRNPTQLVADELRYYQIRTHSGITHDRLVQQIAQYGHMAARFGMALPGIPFRLLRIPETMSYVAQDKNGERYRTQSDHALMSLEPDEEWVRVITEMSHKAALSLSAPTVAPPAALPAGTVEYEIVEEPDEPDGYDHSWEYEDEESEVTEADDPPPADPKVPQQNNGDDGGNGITARAKSTPRPWPAELLRLVIEFNVKRKEPERPSPKAAEGLRGLMVGKLDDLFDGQPAKRLEFLDYLFNVKTSKVLRKAQVQVVLDWLLDGEEFNVHARAEAENCIRQGALERGQEDMFEDDAELTDGELAMRDADIDHGVLDYFLMEPAALVAHAQTQGLVVTLEKGAVVVKNTDGADADLVRALATRPDIAGVLKAEGE